MKLLQILLEYDRDRARQALGDGLWLAMLADILGVQGSSIADIRREAEASGWGQEVLSNPEQQKKLANSALEQIEAVDPSINKKYTQWMARQFMTSEPHLEDVLSTLSDYVTKFHKLNAKRKLPPGENDINRYKTAKQLYLVMDRYDDPVNNNVDQGKASKAYEDANVTVIVPEDEAAACRYGRQTRWCTAAVHGSNYFDQYNRQGPLYILIPKHPTRNGEKYQLHFESSQYMDENDDPTDIGQLLEDRFPSLIKFFMSIPDVAEKLQDMIQFTSDETLQSIIDKVWNITYNHVVDVISEWEAHDDSYFEWLQSEGYVDDDGDIDWSKAPSYTEYNDDARRWMMDVEEYGNPSPTTLRRIANELVQEGKFDDTNVYDINYYIAQHMRWEMRKEIDGGIPDWMEKNISIKPTIEGPMVYLIKRDITKIRESTGHLTLSDLAEISTNMLNADFWIRRSGSINSVGEILTNFNPDAIGIRVTATDKLNPSYLKYVFQYLHMKGTWKQLSTGAINLVHIKVTDVKNLKISTS